VRKVDGTTAMVWAALILSALAGGVSKALEFAQPGASLTRFASASYEPLYILANAIALYFCRRISRDHQKGSRMRLAWLLMAASCAMALVRHGFEWTTFLMGWHQTARLVSVVSLRQIPTVLAMVLLTAGLIAMWSSLAAIGLGTGFRPRDLVLPLVILALMAAVLPYRGELSDHRSVYPLMRYLQWSSPVVLAVPALISLGLQRISQEMGRSQFADFLRYLAWSLLLRLASLLATFTPVLKSVSVLAVAGTAAFWAAPWLFVLAVEQRWRITKSVSELTEVYVRNPQEAFAMSVSSPHLFHAEPPDPRK